MQADDPMDVDQPVWTPIEAWSPAVDVTRVARERGGRPPHVTCADVTTFEDLAQDRHAYVCTNRCPS